MRDGVVRVACAALDPDVRVRVVARKQTIGAVSLWYELSLCAEQGAFRLSRYLTEKAHSEGTELCGATQHPAVHGLGAINQLELRVQGPTLEGWVNGARVCATHDAALGIGSVAIAAGTSEKRRRVLFQSFEVTEVTA
jgi:hypothetical protein